MKFVVPWSIRELRAVGLRELRQLVEGEGYRPFVRRRYADSARERRAYVREAGLARFEVRRRAFGEHRRAGAFEQLFEAPLRARKLLKGARLAHGFERRAEVEPLRVHYDALHQVADEDDLVFEAVFFSELVFFLVEYFKKCRPYVAAAGERYFVYHRSVLRLCD